MDRSQRIADRAGYILHAVLILLALLVIGVGLSLRDTAFGMKESRLVRATVEMDGALDHGLNAAMAKIATEDPAVLLDPTANWDIFNDLTPGHDFVPPSAYPVTGPLAGAFRVRVGIRLGQLSQSAVGSSVDGHYGQIVEVQILVEATAPELPPIEKRLTVGVLVPRGNSHAN
ncbi:MAG: hypothetical protein IPK13_03520 [Deltaproteobacteria bacterium]|nr:hypothetical protein [Deltaproteobacteria bacterium]